MTSLKMMTRKWAASTASCKKCDISYFCNHKVTHYLYIPLKKIPDRLDVLFIGEAPGQVEYAEKEPFVGPAGITCREIIAEALPPNISYCITNSILCTPFTDDSRYNLKAPSLSEIAACSEHIARLAETLKPKNVVALGKVALKTAKEVNKISKYQLPEPLYVLHPSKIGQARDYDYQFAKAVQEIRLHCLKET